MIQLRRAYVFGKGLARDLGHEIRPTSTSFLVPQERIDGSLVFGCDLVCLDVGEVTTLRLPTGGNDAWAGFQPIAILTLGRPKIYLEARFSRFSHGLVGQGCKLLEKLPYLGRLALSKGILKGRV